MNLKLVTIYIQQNMKKSLNMYAVTFDIDTNCLKEQFEEIDIPNDIYEKIKKFMISNNFEWKQGKCLFWK